MHLLDGDLNERCIKFSLYFKGAFLGIRGRTCVLKGCSRTHKTPNSPPLTAGE